MANVVLWLFAPVPLVTFDFCYGLKDAVMGLSHERLAFVVLQD